MAAEVGVVVVEAGATEDLERVLDAPFQHNHDGEHESLRILEELAGKAALAKHNQTVTLTERHIRDMGGQP
jgi:hypothetical protein